MAKSLAIAGAPLLLVLLLAAGNLAAPCLPETWSATGDDPGCTPCNAGYSTNGLPGATSCAYCAPGHGPFAMGCPPCAVGTAKGGFSPAAGLCAACPGGADDAPVAGREQCDCPLDGHGWGPLVSPTFGMSSGAPQSVYFTGNARGYWFSPVQDISVYQYYTTYTVPYEDVSFALIVASDETFSDIFYEFYETGVSTGVGYRTLPDDVQVRAGDAVAVFYARGQTVQYAGRANTRLVYNNKEIFALGHIHGDAPLTSGPPSSMVLSGTDSSSDIPQVNLGIRLRDCQRCGVDEYIDPATGQCIDCPTSESTRGLSGQAVCLGCGDGYGRANATDPCLVCPVDTFHAAADQDDACRPCPSQAHTDGATGAVACSWCRAGYIPSPVECGPCPADTFRADDGDPAVCQACPVGWGTNLATGATSCDYCALGYTYNNGTGTCDACGAGTSTIFPVTDESVCQVCPLGQITTGLATACVCPCGYAWRPDGCDICPADTFSDGTGPCQPCVGGTGTTLEEGSCVCAGCARGTDTDIIGTGTLATAFTSLYGNNNGGWFFTPVALHIHNVTAEIGSATSSLANLWMAYAEAVVQPEVNLEDMTTIVYSINQPTDHIFVVDAVIPARSWVFFIAERDVNLGTTIPSSQPVIAINGLVIRVWSFSHSSNVNEAPPPSVNMAGSSYSYIPSVTMFMTAIACVDIPSPAVSGVYPTEGPNGNAFTVTVTGTSLDALNTQVLFTPVAGEAFANGDPPVLCPILPATNFTHLYCMPGNLTAGTYVLDVTSDGGAAVSDQDRTVRLFDYCPDPTCTGRGNNTGGICECFAVGVGGVCCESVACPIGDCSNHGTCQSANGTCVCHSGYERPGCNFNPSLHCPSYTAITLGGDLTNATIFSNVAGAVYANSSECEWLIEGPENSNFAVTFAAFDTEAFADQLVIYNTPTVSNDLVATLSGDLPEDTLTYRSAGNVILVRFATSAEVAATGWSMDVALLESGLTDGLGAGSGGSQLVDEEDTLSQLMRVVLYVYVLGGMIFVIGVVIYFARNKKSKKVEDDDDSDNADDGGQGVDGGLEAAVQYVGGDGAGAVPQKAMPSMVDSYMVDNVNPIFDSVGSGGTTFADPYQTVSASTPVNSGGGGGGYHTDVRTLEVGTLNSNW